MRPSSTVAAILFIIVAILQAIRYFNGWVITINGMDVPLWASLFGAIVPALMALWLLYDNEKKKLPELPDEKVMGNKTWH